MPSAEVAPEQRGVPGWRLTSLGLFFVTLSGFVATGAVLPVLPRFVAGPLDGGDVAVGVAMGAFAVSAVVVRPLAGRWADDRGRRPIVLGGTLLCSLAGAALLAASSLEVVVLSRLVVGAGEGLLFTAASAWVIDLAPEDRRGQVIGLFGLSVWGGISLGPAIGDQLLEKAGYDAVWVAVAVIPLAGALVAFRLAESWRPPPVPEVWPLVPRPVIAPGAALALANVGYAALAGFAVLLLADRGIEHGAFVFTAYAAAIVATRLLLGRLPDVLGPGRPAALAGFTEAVGLVIIARAGSWGLAVVGAAVMGAGSSLLYPSLVLGVVRAMGEAARGRALGGFTAFFDIGIGVGAPLVGAVASVAGYEAAFWAAAGAAMAAALIGSRLPSGRPRARLERSRSAASALARPVALPGRQEGLTPAVEHGNPLRNRPRTSSRSDAAVSDG